MKYLIDQGKKTVSVFGLFLLWFMLSGVKRGPGADASDLSTSDLAATNILKSMPPISTWPLSFWITLFFMIFGGIGTFYGIRYLREKQEQEQMLQHLDARQKFVKTGVTMSSMGKKCGLQMALVQISTYFLLRTLVIPSSGVKSMEELQRSLLRRTSRVFLLGRKKTNWAFAPVILAPWS